MLRKSPVFSCIVILTLALGIGATTTAFSIVDAVLLKKLPVREPERLFQAIRLGGADHDEERDDFAYATFLEMRERVRPFADLLADADIADDIAAIDGRAGERVRHHAVSENYFEALRVQPAIGRVLAPDDNRESPVAVISYGFWRRCFNLDPAVVGRTVRFGSNSFQIIGVARLGFFGLQVGTLVDVWTPAASEPDARHGNISWLRLTARLKLGATAEQAKSAMDARIKLVHASKGISYLRAEYRQPLQIVMLLVALVLLVACTNIANLLLARASARQREMAVRLMLGAGRMRLVRQLLTESLLLAGAGAAAGLVLSLWAAPLLVSMLAPSDSPVQLALGIDWRVMGFTVAVCVTTALLFGLVPACSASKVQIHAALKTGVRMSDGGARLGKSLVALQIALSLVLLVGATLFLRTLINLVRLDPGFDRHNLNVAEVQFNGPRGERLHLAWEELRRRASAIPGVESDSLSGWSLFSVLNWTELIRIPGTPLDPKERLCYFMKVSTGFFRTMHTRLIEGRDFEPPDFEPAAVPVAVVNQTLARRHFLNESPIGKTFSMEGEPPRWIQVIGIVQDTKYDNLRKPAPPLIYLPYTLGSSDPRMSLEVAGRVDMRSIAAFLRREARAASPNFAVEKITTLNKLVDDTLLRESLLAKLASFFGMVALLLSAIGIYGIMSYVVTQRTQEIGIRMALGAERRDVLRMVLRESITVLAAGVTVGTAVALATMRVVASLLFGLAPHDPAAMFIGVGVLVAVALA